MSIKILVQINYRGTSKTSWRRWRTIACGCDKPVRSRWATDWFPVGPLSWDFARKEPRRRSIRMRKKIQKHSKRDGSEPNQRLFVYTGWEAPPRNFAVLSCYSTRRTGWEAESLKRCRLCGEKLVFTINRTEILRSARTLRSRQNSNIWRYVSEVRGKVNREEWTELSLTESNFAKVMVALEASLGFPTEWRLDISRRRRAGLNGQFGVNYEQVIILWEQADGLVWGPRLLGQKRRIGR